MSGARHWEQDKEATVYIGNLDERVTDSLVWELMLQVGRIANIHLPKDRVTQSHQGYGFVEFTSEEDAEYAAKIMNQVRLFGKPIRVNKASADKQKTVEVGAELFIGNLDPLVTEQTLFETFSRFGGLLSIPKIARDDANLSKGYGFVSFSSFEASDEAIANLNGQYLMNKEVSVQYAYKKDGKGERHGDEAERTLAAESKKNMTAPAGPGIANPFHQAIAPTPALPSTPLEANPFGMSTAPPNAQYAGMPQTGEGYGPSPIPNGRPIGPPSHLPPSHPSGLPSRPPPPPVAGYGGQQAFYPAGFNPPSSAPYVPGPPPGLPPGFQGQMINGQRP